MTMILGVPPTPFELHLSQEDFITFRDFFYRKTGIHYSESKAATVAARLSKRMQATGFHEFRAYFTHMRCQVSGGEMQHLINTMTVNETFFFREENQLRCLVNSVMDEVMHYKAPHEGMRLWSIPSSTGEEPYSLAIYLLEHWPPVDRVDVSLFASDIDTQVLEKARRGLYSQRSVQNLPTTVLKRYFERVDDESYQICDTLRESIDFSLINLMDRAKTKRFRGLDVIFCRNMLIYFDQASRRQAAEILYDALNPGGFLFLGHTESMSRISSLFQVRRFPDAFAYQKPLHSS